MADAATIAGAVCGFFEEQARVLPWRPAGRRDPYHALVSELMLQQTQVSRVIDRFEAFVDRFPDVRTLAAARESSVLAMWSGLGYYRRARALHAAAKVIVRDHGGEVPSDVATLRSLPGVGEYTAGAIASIVFGERTCAVDGNVIRVLLRLEGRRLTAAEGKAPVTALATSLVEETESPALLNEGLMELGATVCTPTSPSCERCALARWCVARARGEQAEIPTPPARRARDRLWCASVIVRDEAGRLLVERRPAKGLWAGLWQAPTVERKDRPPRATEVAKALGVDGVRRIGAFERTLTHRQVSFTVYEGAGASGAFKTRRQIERLGLASPQRRILLEMS